MKTLRNHLAALAVAAVVLCLWSAGLAAQTYATKVHMKPGGAELVVASGGAITVESGGSLTVAGVTIDSDTLAMDGVTASAAELNTLDGISATTAELNGVRTAQEYQAGFGSAKAGTTAGWVVAAGDNMYQATLPASQSASTLVVPVAGLKVGWTITAFKCESQIESAGNAVTLDADLRKLSNAAGDPVDASVGAITQVSVTADTKSEAAKTSLSDAIGADERFYILITGTTTGSTDVRFLGCTVTVTTS